jgi:hypothetical protein
MIYQTLGLILTCAELSGAVESRFAFALELAGVRVEQAESIDVAVHVGAAHLTRVDALLGQRGADALGAGVGWAGHARGLLRVGLEGALLALHARVEGSVQIGAGQADRQRALLDGSGTQLGGGAAGGTRLAGGVATLRPESAAGARLATSLGAELQTG